MKNLSYKNDPNLKEMFVAEVRRHREDDQIVQGTYGKENGKWRGCAVGCSLHSLNAKLGTDYMTSDHKALADEILGGQEWLAHLEDTIFEGLPVEKAMLWPEQFAEAIPVGANLEPVKWKFCAFLMKENIERVLTLDIEENLKKQVVDAIRGVLAVHEKAIETGEWDDSAARSAAYSAAYSAADSAHSAADSAADSARSAAHSAADSARSAAHSAADSAADSAAYERYAKQLLELLKNTL